MAMTTIPYGVNLVLPDDIRSRYHIKADTLVRVITTQNGILLVPLTPEPMSAQLVEELEAWQTLGSDALSAFPYEDADE